MSTYLKDSWFVKFMKWVSQYVIGWTWIWQKILYPIWSKMFNFYKKVSSWYFLIWKRVVYKNNSFSRKRAGIMIIMTSLFLYIIPVLGHISYQSVMYIFSNRTEVIYLTMAEEINPDYDIHSIRGCEIIPCSENDSIYFRVRPTAFHHLYSVITKGNIFYPDLIASVVAPGVNECTVNSYGIRVKTLMRKYDFYPDMLSATCKPFKINS